MTNKHHDFVHSINNILYRCAGNELLEEYVYGLNDFLYNNQDLTPSEYQHIESTVQFLLNILYEEERRVEECPCQHY